MIPDMSQRGGQPQSVDAASAGAPTILLDHVSKWYGSIVGLNDVSIAISGGVTGILGMNGAGKSTLFKLLTGKLKPSQGTVRLFGIDPWQSTSPFGRIGYVSESEKMYDWMTGLEFVSTMARLHGMTREEAVKESERVIEFVGMSDAMNKRIGKYSKGMRQRIKIAHALVNDPELIVLDEPLQGCDPLARTTIMNVIRELGAQGRTVLVSSHILQEIERITEQIVILHRGRLLALGNLHAIRSMLDEHPHSIRLTCEDPREISSHLVSEEQVYGLQFESSEGLTIKTRDLGKMHAKLPSLIKKSGVRVTGIENPDDNLESILQYLTGGES
jgi:ABC-2 type transport system ATP-binding protein